MPAGKSFIKKTIKVSKYIVDILTDIAFYGNDWRDDNAPFSMYDIGVQEATAFIVACFISRNVTGDSVATSDTLKALGLDKPSVSRVKMRERVVSFLKDLGVSVIEVDD